MEGKIWRIRLGLGLLRWQSLTYVDLKLTQTITNAKDLGSLIKHVFIHAGARASLARSCKKWLTWSGQSGHRRREWFTVQSGCCFQPLWKIWKSGPGVIKFPIWGKYPRMWWDDESQLGWWMMKFRTEWENNRCSKPPTSLQFYIDSVHQCTSWMMKFRMGK